MRNLIGMLKCLIALSIVLTVIPARADERVPVVVELFTSEGCSSCPPADSLVTQLAKDQPVPGAEIIVLGEHVDYWNYIGWTDRFSSAQWTARQQAYVRRMRLDSAYTPQLVVDGQIEIVGNDDRRVLATIASQSQRKKAAQVLLRLEGNTLAVDVLSEKGLDADVILAITEGNLKTVVKAGENGGRTLMHSAVVRNLMPLGSMRGQSFETTRHLGLARAWNRKELRAVVFVQQKGQRAILGAKSLALR
jgi:hypothetical protein